MSAVAYDLVIIGAGPAGQKAAVQAAKAGKSVLLIERAAQAGGECVRRGTIPSKALREQALEAVRFRKRMSSIGLGQKPVAVGLQAHIKKAADIASAHVRTAELQLGRNHIDRARGQAHFLDAKTLEIVDVTGTRRRVKAESTIIATGSRPRATATVAVDHEHVFDSDSILELAYLPASLAVLGGGVIACEYASIFQALGARVTIIDRAPQPLGFLDGSLRDHFVASFTRAGGRVLSSTAIERVAFDGFDAVEIVTSAGKLSFEKTLVCLGRSACVDGLHLDAAGVRIDSRGYVEVDAHLCAAPGIYAAGDVIGPPALASTSMEQGRRAARHALGLPAHAAGFDIVPVGVYTIPELAAVGLTEDEARSKHGDVVVGRANNTEIARGMIRGDEEGFLKIVSDPYGRRILGVHAAGVGAAELIHVGQLAMIGGLTVEDLVDHVFNFPTMAESFRVAALAVLGKRDVRAAEATAH